MNQIFHFIVQRGAGIQVCIIRLLFFAVDFNRVEGFQIVVEMNLYNLGGTDVAGTLVDDPLAFLIP